MSAQPVAAETVTPPDPLLTLSGRLIAPNDRESYADLVLWLRSLPPGDEMVKLDQLLGFLTLMGHELPAALTEQLKQLMGCGNSLLPCPNSSLRDTIRRRLPNP